MEKPHINRDPWAKGAARRFRSNMGVSEQWLWAALRKDNLGVRFRRQHPIEPYFLDFYAPAVKLCIEVDGDQHAERAEADAVRDAYLAERGILTLRIPSRDLFDKETALYTHWIDRIQRLVNERLESM